MPGTSMIANYIHIVGYRPWHMLSVLEDAFLSFTFSMFIEGKMSPSGTL